jgi:hypothetical protein
MDVKSNIILKILLFTPIYHTYVIPVDITYFKWYKTCHVNQCNITLLIIADIPMVKPYHVSFIEYLWSVCLVIK